MSHSDSDNHNSACSITMSGQ